MVDSRASMHMSSKTDVGSAELETFRKSRNPATVVTANGEVQTNEEVHTVYVHDLELFVTVQILEDTHEVPVARGKLCEANGYSYEWTSSQKPQLTKNANIILCKYGKFRADCCPRIGDGFFQPERKFVFYIFTAGHVW